MRASWRRRISTSSSSGRDVFEGVAVQALESVVEAEAAGIIDALDADRSEADHQR